MLHMNIVGVVTCSDNSTRRLVTCSIWSFFCNSFHYHVTQFHCCNVSITIQEKTKTEQHAINSCHVLQFHVLQFGLLFSCPSFSAPPLQRQWTSCSDNKEWHDNISRCLDVVETRRHSWAYEPQTAKRGGQYTADERRRLGLQMDWLTAQPPWDCPLQTDTHAMSSQPPPSSSSSSSQAER